MCRILFLKWTNKKLALNYIDALKNAWCNDVYLEDVVKLLWIPKIKNQHIHWWGYLFVSSDYFYLYKSWKFIWEDEIWFEKLKNLISSVEGEFLLMSELRLTDVWYTWAFYAQPFQLMTKNWYDWYLFFNWLMDYEKLAWLENIEYDNYKKKNWTLILSLSIAKEIEKWKSVKEAIQKPKAALKSWYNLMMFLHWPNWYHAYVNAYVIPDLLKHKIAYNYYKLLKKHYDDLIFIGSSAIWNYINEDFDIMENGEFLSFDIDFIKEDYFDAYN